MEGKSARCRRRRQTHPRVLVAIALALLAGGVVGAGPANAAPMSNSQAVSVASNSQDLTGFLIPGPIPLPAPIPIVLTNVKVDATAKWSGDITTDVGWDGDKVRQGQNLDVSRTASATSGKIDVKWTIEGFADGIHFGPTNLSKDNIACAPKLSDGTLHCEGSSTEIPLGSLPSGIPLPGPPIVVAVLGIGIQFDVTPEGVIVTRGFSIGGNPVAGPDDLSLTDSPLVDTLSVPCSAKAGDAVDYTLDPYGWTPSTKATQQTRIRIILAYDPTGTTEVGQIGGDINLGPAAVSNFAFQLNGTGFKTAMGALLANNISPTIAPLGPFSGDEGSPISFSASVDSQCPIASYVWEFSNGTKSFGPSPQRAFGDNGVYDGQLTVTDITGLSATRDFTVSVANVAPSVNAGPDTTADWGRLVAFNGQATDPGWIDQPTLQYTWTFGDGTPSASGGPSVIHAYALPGNYVATLTVCDKDESPLTCPSDTRTVVVTSRDTTLGYTGPLSSSPSKTIALTAHLVDEYGEPVQARKVSFALGTQTAVGTTDAAGNASASIKLSQKPGSYPLSATFVGDTKYNASADAGLTFVVGK